MKIRIQSDGLWGGSTKIVDADTGEPIPGKYYAYEISGGIEEANRATLFGCVDGFDIEAVADVIEVPTGLRERAEKIAKEFHDIPEVQAAFIRLFGSPFPAAIPGDTDNSAADVTCLGDRCRRKVKVESAMSTPNSAGAMRSDLPESQPGGPSDVNCVDNTRFGDNSKTLVPAK